MASVNKVILIGNLGADPEMRSAGNGDAICNLRLATSESWADKGTGEKRESTEWHRVVLYRRLAEVADRYLKKGSRIYIEGKIKSRRWQDKDGTERTISEIEATSMTMLDTKVPSAPGTMDGNGAFVHRSISSSVRRGTNPPPDLPDDTIPF